MHEKVSFNEGLKYREETGRIGYRTKFYENVIPQDGEIFVAEDEKVGIYRGDEFQYLNYSKH
jgi:hypothetical protein